LPKGGGAIRGIGEKFAANPVTGTGSMSVPIATSPGRSGFGPQLSLSYDSGAGNGPFGFGWSLSLPAITRKTDKGLPQYRDAEESDVFILSGAEDLVPVFKTDPTTGEFVKDDKGNFACDEFQRDGYLVRRYRPRIEGLFARIERWTNVTDDSDTFWRSISKDNVTTWYGKTAESRIADPASNSRIFSWLICQSYDDKGNAILYEYQAEGSPRIFEDQQGQLRALAHERNRDDVTRSANRYLRRIKYGNRTPNRDASWKPTDPTVLTDWMFEVVIDYEEGHYEMLPLDPARPEAEQHRFVLASASAGAAWPVRQDPFSTYRPGFEVRTYRLCRRVLMFHHFADELSAADCLVRSTEFSYTESPIASFITGVTRSGYVIPDLASPNRYLKKSLPSLEFEYSQVPDANELAQQLVWDVDEKSLENLPVGLDGGNYQWMDLDGVGTSGVLTEQADGWYYKRNISANNIVRENGHERTVARFGPVEVAASKPAVELAGGGQFLDLSGDGQVDLVEMEGFVRGFYERSEDATWEPFRSFVSWPDVNTRDPDLKFVDLNGDGHADILITEGEALTWYPSLAETGFGPAVRVSLPLDEEKGPRLLFSNGEQSIYLADLSGDGLSDLVRVRNGEVCYWPNLGYGLFGAKVTMDNGPWFDAPDQFDQRRIRLADIDGSGTTDIFYLRRDGVQIYFNQSGNSWSNAVTLPQFPPVDNIASIQALDLLGNGTACLVWSSPMPGATRRPMRYIALMDEKPHLLISVKNNLGAETKVHYASSTKFYLDDEDDGKPWITRLPFSVQCVERVETYDRVSSNRFVSRYTYHHGYFDGPEREFRGFGRVEQLDTEEIGSVSSDELSSLGTNLDVASFVPPIRTKTWFHTGAYVEGEKISRHFEHEYYGAPKEGDQDYDKKRAAFEGSLPEDTILPPDLTPDEQREACRALKGSMLRQEVYADDAPDGAPEEIIKWANTPYTVTEQNFTIEVLQPQGTNRHAVFFTHAREALSYHYERNPDDPRISHTMTLEVDDYGNVLKSVAIGYGRKQSPLTEPSDQGKQMRLLITFTQNSVTNAIDDTINLDDYRTPLPSEAITYELTGFKPENGAERFSFDHLSRNDFDALSSATEIQYEETADPSKAQKRQIEHVRILYRKDDLSGLLPIRKAPIDKSLESLALPGETYKLALTPGLISQIFKRKVGAGPEENLLPDPVKVLGSKDVDRGGYVDLDNDGRWWIPSDRVFYSRDRVADELGEAKAHFFLPRRFEDAFSNPAFIDYDAYDLLLEGTEDALQNKVTATNDYRVLQPKLMTDPNGNRSEVAFDVLGMVAGTAVMGKTTENLGDSLAGFEPDPTSQQVRDFVDAGDPRALAGPLLGSATTRIIYDLDCFKANGQPVFAATLARETHVSDLADKQQTSIQMSCSYSDGFGREIQKKIQAEPGPVPKRDGNGKIIVDADGHPEMIANDVSPRWVGSGWTVFNNKGKPVRQYEPFFTDTHGFDFDARIGVSPVLFYDPVERVIATLHPNNTYEKVVFDPWEQKTFDANDTAAPNGAETGDPRTDPDIKECVAEYFKTQPKDWQAWYAQRINNQMGDSEREAAVKAAAHANTPTVAHFDSLGRTFVTVADNGIDENGKPQKYNTRIELDIEGNQRALRDAIVQNDDVLGRIVIRYDYDMLSNRIHETSMEAGERWMLNDVTGKPIRAWDSRGFMRRMAYDELRRPTGLFVTEVGVERLAEQTVYGETQGSANNLRTRVYQAKDSAGIVTNIAYDFKGNLLRGSRALLSGDRYKTSVDWNQTDEVFASSSLFDALNRIIQQVAPHSNRPGTKLNIVQPTYNEASLLETVDVWLEQVAEPWASLDPKTASLHAITNIDYNAKGQRVLIEYGVLDANQKSEVNTTYQYDPETFRLANLTTTRKTDKVLLQDLQYYYDPVGNITHIHDDADIQNVIYFKNRRVEPSADYVYDAIYRLIKATGREHLGQTGDVPNSPTPQSYNDWSNINLPHPNDGNAMGTYIENFDYDAAGNIQQIQHIGSEPANPGWKRTYAYDETSLLEPSKQSNRLTSTTVGGVTDNYSAAGDGYDAHGNMLRMPPLQIMQWDFKDQLQMTQRQRVNNDDVDGAQRQGERTYYVYDSSGQRVRKVTEFASGQLKNERIYLGGFEVYREYDNSGAVTLERETLHIMDDKQRVALVETRTRGNDGSREQLVRYQFGNHLGSASLELDDQANVISYEEYYPYGSTSYQAVDQNIEAAAKRYRYTGKERDEESGLYYHGARYYASCLGRWASVDPSGIGEDLNLYGYVRENPIILRDNSGRVPVPTITPPPISPLFPPGSPPPLPAPPPIPYTPWAPPPSVVTVGAEGAGATELGAGGAGLALGELGIGGTVLAVAGAAAAVFAVGGFGYLMAKTDYSYRGEEGASGVPLESRDAGVDEPPRIAPGRPDSNPVTLPAAPGHAQIETPAAKPSPPVHAPAHDPALPLRAPELPFSGPTRTIPYVVSDRHPVPRDEQGHPIFPSHHDVRIPDKLLSARDRAQFRDALAQLKAYITLNPRAWKEFTREQQNAIRAAFAGATEGSKAGRIAGHIWHHDPVDVTILHLVPKEIHEKHPHVGSTALTGRKR
jgi:RHS repeat-associated protein